MEYQLQLQISRFLYIQIISFRCTKKIPRKAFFFFTFFYIHKKKVLDSRKFSNCGFRWIYMFWDVLNTIWPFLENICLSVSLYVFPKFCGHCISRTNVWKSMELYIQLHLYGIWSWLDFGAYRSKSSDVIQNFSFL